MNVALPRIILAALLSCTVATGALANAMVFGSSVTPATGCCAITYGTITDPVAASGATSDGLAASSANLATGALRATATSVPVTILPIGIASPISGQIATAEMTDKLHFNGFAPLETGVLAAFVHGTNVPGPGESAPFYQFHGPTAFGALTVNIGGPAGSGTTNFFQTRGCVPAVGAPCWNGTSFSQEIDTSFQLDANIPIDLSLEAQATDGGSAQFGNTVQFQLVLPQGVAFTSDSGVFLSEAQPVIPEPATVVLFGTMLTGLGMFRGRRGRAFR